MRQIWSVVRFHFLGFWKSPRVILTFSLGFVVSFLLSDKVVAMAKANHSVMQAAEPFIWTFGDATAIVLTSVLLLLLFADLPRIEPFSLYYLVRITRQKWLAAQFLYIILSTGLYVLFILVSTTLLCIRYTFPGNLWSETAARLGYSGLGEQMQIPVTVKVMESITPYGCMGQVMLLMLGYSLTLGFLVLAANLLAGRRAGLLAGLLYSLYGFLLNPQVLGKLLGLEEYEMYKIRVFVGWVSPVNHSVYGMHNFGYDLLPKVWQSMAVFGVLLALLWFLAERLLRNYNFAPGGRESG